MEKETLAQRREETEGKGRGRGKEKVEILVKWYQSLTFLSRANV